MLANLSNKILFYFFATLVPSTVLLAQSTPRESLLILSKSDHTLAIVDPGTLKVLTRIPGLRFELWWRRIQHTRCC